MFLLSCLVLAQAMAGGNSDAKPVRRTNPGPAITGPIKGGEHGWPFAAYFGDMGSVDYVEEEYFLEGDATRYFSEGELTNDGLWSLEKGSSSPYKTRILVRKPVFPSDFNGTVVLEWANVSSGYEIGMGDPPGLYINGFVYVMVSAQPVGVAGYEQDPKGLVAWDGERYGSLHIPDEGVCFDIFTQAAKSVGPNRSSYINGKDPLAGFEVKKLIGIGGSQSGSRITSYINGVQPLEQVFDALISTLNAGSSTDFLDEIAHPAQGQNGRPVIFTKIRQDQPLKVFALNSEAESLYYTMVRQPDSDTFRSWEVAGASHAPTRTMQILSQKTDRDGLTDTINTYRAGRSSDVNWLYTVDAAIYHTHKWITDGTPPPPGRQMEADLANREYRRDANGNALGGVRLPELEVPIASYGLAALGGTTTPFNEAKLLQLYPTHEDYVNKVTAAARAAEEAGYILPYRVEEYVKMAEAAPVPVFAAPAPRTR
jgi:hypothetical protein